MANKKKDDEIIELTDEELEEILSDEDLNATMAVRKSILSFSPIPTHMFM